MKVSDIFGTLHIQRKRRNAWKWINIGDEGIVFKCSLCGNKNTIESNYCPNCGAKMTESEDEE